MSAIRFLTHDHAVKLCGRERHHMGNVVRRIAMSVVPFGGDRIWGGEECESLRDKIIPGHRLSLPPKHDSKASERDRNANWDAWRIWSRSMDLELAHGDTPMFQAVLEENAAPVPLESFSLVLNTAMRVGGDAVKLCARLHGQCELHAWVDEADRPWLAGIIEAGRDVGLLRAEGWLREWGTWEGVVELLLAIKEHPGPVVTDYSVSDSFTWNQMKRLRRNETRLQLKPEDWNDFTFMHGLSLLDLFDPPKDE